MASSDPFQPDEKELRRLSPAKRRELRDILAGIQDALKRNPLATYVPYEKQRQFHSASERYRLFIGGNRAGKSTCGAADDLIQALPPDFVPKHLMPFKKYGHSEAFKGRVITPDLGHTMEVVITKFRQMVPKAALHGGEWGKAFDKTRRVLRFEHGSTIDFMSTEQDVDKFGGVDLHRIHFDEEPDGPNVPAIWQECRWRILDHGGDFILTMTPLFGVSSLIHDEIWDRRGEDHIFAVQASVWDNPNIPKREVEEALRGMTEEEKKARVYGEFVHFAGLFYDEFSDHRHVVKPPRPADLKGMDVVVGIDPGLERTGIVWVAFDNDNAAMAFAELYPHDELIPEIANKIRAKNREWGIEPSFYVIDPAARIRAQVSREQIESAYLREGIPTIHGQNERGPGIMEVKRRLQQGALTVSAECTNLIWEFGRYRKDPNSQDEFAALKRDDHLLDALRYVAMSRPWGPYGSAQGDENWQWTPGQAPRWDELDNAVQGPNPPLGAMT